MSDRKIQFLLPNLFTALNMSCGFVAIISAIKGDITKALYLVIIGSFFDLFDGRVARWTGTQSSFGEQFDSLSDLITFGMTPSLIFYLNFFQDSGRKGVVASLLFCLCGSLRLARFNTNIDKVDSSYFEGLPIPGAAMALIGFVFFSRISPEYHLERFAIAYILIYAFLMISTIPFFSFKDGDFVARHRKKFFLLMIEMY